MSQQLKHHKIFDLPQAIKSKQGLWHYLRVTMEVKLSTIPPYLSALYSIKPSDTSQEPGYGRNQPAYDVIHSVVMEEMLHLTLAGNILNATGGAALLNDPEFVPASPTQLLDSYIEEGGELFEVPLQGLTEDAIDVFMRIELPERPHAPPRVKGWHSIGQFYDGLKKGLYDLCESHGYD